MEAMLGSFDETAVYAWNHEMGPLLLWIYALLSTVVLVNLLVAMMADTYTEVKSMSDEEWKFGRLHATIEAAGRYMAVPPPLNLPATLLTLLFEYSALKLFQIAPHCCVPAFVWCVEASATPFLTGCTFVHHTPCDGCWQTVQEVVIVL